MLKTIGIIFIIIAGSFFGIRAAEALHTRYKKLRSHLLFMGEAADMMRQGASLEVILQSPSLKGLCNADGYSATVLPDGIRNEDIKLISDFYEGLGMSDLEAGLSRCEAYRELLKKRVDEAEEEMKSKSRLYGILGISASLFIVILLM